MPDLDLAALKAAAEAMLEAEIEYRTAHITRDKKRQDEALTKLAKAYYDHMPNFTTPVPLALITRLEAAEARLHDAADAIEHITGTDPYRKSLFLELTDDDWESLKGWCKSRGFALDRLSGNYGRLFRKVWLQQLGKVRVALAPDGEVR